MENDKHFVQTSSERGFLGKSFYIDQSNKLNGFDFMNFTKSENKDKYVEDQLKFIQENKIVCPDPLQPFLWNLNNFPTRKSKYYSATNSYYDLDGELGFCGFVGGNQSQNPKDSFDNAWFTCETATGVRNFSENENLIKT